MTFAAFAKFIIIYNIKRFKHSYCMLALLMSLVNPNNSCRAIEKNDLQDSPCVGAVEYNFHSLTFPN